MCVESVGAARFQGSLDVLLRMRLILVEASVLDAIEQQHQPWVPHQTAYVLGAPRPEDSTILLLLVRQSQIDGRCGLRIVSGDAVARAWGSEARKYVARDIAETLASGFDLIDGQAGHQMVQLLLFAGVGVFFGHGV